MDRVQAATGRVPIIYTGKYFWNDNVGSGDFAGNPLWLAAYVSPCPSTPGAWGGWSMWQYNDNGSIPGIAGNVDVDIFNGTIDQLDALASPPNQAPIGYIDSADCSSIAGWAQDQDMPDQPIDVHLYFDGNPGDPGARAFAVHADQHRDDLCQAIGSCNHGYSVATPRSLLDGQRRRRARARDDGIGHGRAAAARMSSSRDSKSVYLDASSDGLRHRGDG